MTGTRFGEQGTAGEAAALECEGWGWTCVHLSCRVPRPFQSRKVKTVCLSILSCGAPMRRDCTNPINNARLNPNRVIMYTEPPPCKSA
jgi:hypothetical protein